MWSLLGSTSVRKEKVTEMKYLIYVVLKVHDDLHKSPKGQKASSSPPLEAETFIKKTHLNLRLNEPSRTEM